MSDPRRGLPAVHALVAEAEAAGLAAAHGGGELAAAAREVLAAARAQGGAPPGDGWLRALERELVARGRPALRRVVNATGVVLHTNLGRAPLAAAARAAVTEALGYSALEMELASGARGSRQQHVRTLLRELTGAEDALVVNNAAAALFLVLHALAHGHETIVSRGELVEIGGAFRIPEILAQSGSTLIEVGTTNRTRLRDYELALAPRTRLLLKVHRSNFELRGFVSEASLTDLVALGRARGIPVVHDVGSGLLVPLERFGLTGEPLLRDSVASRAVVICSGDKLLGGPQAGIVLGPQALVERAAANPLARALRPDKATLAALAATLRLYRDPARVLAAVPVLAMLTADPASLRRRARRLARRLPGARTAPGASAVGGGAFPGCELPTTVVTLAVPSCDAALARLRAHDPPVIARAAEGQIVLDVRTLADDELATVADAMRRVLAADCASSEG